MLYLISLFFTIGLEHAEHHVFAAWLKAHQGQESWEHFIKRNYEGDTLQKLNMQDHIQFYQTIQNEFGKLKPAPYKVIEDKPGLYMVYMVREDQDMTKEIAAENVLVVTVELASGSPKLKKSLGLGSLICYQKK